MQLRRANTLHTAAAVGLIRELSCRWRRMRLCLTGGNCRSRCNSCVNRSRCVGIDAGKLQVDFQFVGGTRVIAGRQQSAGAQQMQRGEIRQARRAQRDSATPNIPADAAGQLRLEPTDRRPARFAALAGAPGGVHRLRRNSCRDNFAPWPE